MNNQRDPKKPIRNTQRPTAQNSQRPIRNVNQGNTQRTAQRPSQRPTNQSAPQRRPSQPNRPRVNEVEALASRRRYLQEKKSARRASVIAFFTVFLSLCLVTAIIFAVVINSGKDTKPKEFVVMNIEGTPKAEIPIADAYLNEMLYIDFSAVAKLCGFTSVGDANGITYAFVSASGIDQYITFSYDSNAVSVNGHNVNMEGIAINQNGVLKVPFSFVKGNIGGLEIDVDENERTVTVTREKMTGSKPDDPKYEDIVLFLQPETPIPPIGDEQEFKDPLEVEFISDLSEYEQYMNPSDRDAYLILINREHPADRDYAPTEREHIPTKFACYPDNSLSTMVPIAARALTAMLTEAANYGITDVKVTHAYRSYYTQEWYFNYYIDDEIAGGLSRDEATKLVMTYSAPAGTSEHQSGLCADMHNMYNQYDKELEDFEFTEAYQWLKENCWKFGFILRFPEGKEEITGYQFECWHFRFVGRYHAYQIYSQGLCLEEYIDQLANNN